MIRPKAKPIAWYVKAIKNKGPRAEMLSGVKAGTTLAKMSAGRAMFMVTCDAPREAAFGNRSIFARTYPAMIVRNL